MGPATGRILTFHPGLTRTDFLAATSIPLSEGRAVGKSGWCCSVQRPLNGRTWRLSPFFKGEVLQSVGMGYHQTEPAADWEANERRNQADYQALLRSWVGDPLRTFPWGRVEVYFDEKGVGSGICVYYGKERTGWARKP